MTKREAIRLANVLFGLFYLLSIITPLGATLTAPVSADDSVIRPSNLFSFVQEYGLYLIAGFLLLLVAAPIASLFAPTGDSAIASREDCAEVAILLLGYYAIITMLGGLNDLAGQLLLSANYGISLDSIRVFPPLLTVLLHLILGLWLIKSARSLAVRITGESTQAVS